MKAAAVAGALLAAATPAAASAAGPTLPQKLGNPVCIEPTATTAEAYGPTDIGAALAGARLQVAVNPQGTLSVFRWPSRSYYEQLKYLTTDRDTPRLGLEPNEGAFSGLVLSLAGGAERVVWLRDLDATQRYASDDSDTVITRFRSRELGLTVRVADVAPRPGDVLLRRHVLRLRRSSPVRRAELISFQNFNPVAARRPLLPVRDWCEEVRGDDKARYDRADDAVVYWTSDFDAAAAARSSVAVAIGAGAPSTGHQVGSDSRSGWPAPVDAPEGAYDDAADGRLSGNDELGPGEADSALTYRLRPGRPLTLVFAAAADPAAALAQVRRWRGADARVLARGKRRWYLRWLRRAPLPRQAPPAVLRLARRALVTLPIVIDEHAGPGGQDVAVVASISTQSPYYQDWVRDGAFFNEALDVIGHPRLVARHNAFYVAVQHRLEQGAPPGTPLTTCAQTTPDGNWFMTNWADGADAGFIPWEIDETALGVWTLWRHYGRVRSPGRRAQRLGYLRSVYPAIRRAAEFLVAYRDPTTGLPPATACEDDNPPRPGQPTMHSSGPVLLALRSAADAAIALGQVEDAARYRARAAELADAIDARYDVAGGAWTTGNGDGGWALWPEELKPFSDPRMRAQASAAWADAAPSFQAPDGPRQGGAYEAKALLGLAHWARATGDAAMLANVRSGLRWIAEVQAAWQGTGILGEFWHVRDGRVISVPAQPHAWEQTLFYLAALKAYGRTRR